MRRGVMLVLGAAVVSALVFGSPGVPTPSQAVAEGLPTWEDVEKAKKNEAEGAAKVKEIEELLVVVGQEVEQTRAESEAATAALGEAESKLQDAQLRFTTLEDKAKQSAVEADAAAEQAASLVSQLYRSGGVDRNVELFFEADASAADQLLERLAQVEKATERNTSIADTAARSMNNASTLADQAKEAEKERDRLREEAAALKEQADLAAASALERLRESEEQQKVLEAQLAALKDTTTDTTAGYEERLRLEAEERRRIEEEARRAAEEAAKNQGGGGGGGGGGNTGGGGGGQVSGNWRIPFNGGYWVSDWWGAGRGHTGVDLAIGGGTPIHAASSGTVTMAGWYSPCYGYVTEVTHGNGIATRYAHQIQPPPVSYGQYVEMGQIIGYVGTTGCSLGYHLHFEVYTNGYPIDPVPFFAARGLYF